MNIKDIKTKEDLEEWFAESQLGIMIQEQTNFIQELEVGRVALLAEQEKLRGEFNNLVERVRTNDVLHKSMSDRLEQP